MGIGKRIKEARNALNLTQEELANLLGVTKGAVANYENETSHPKEPIMYKMFDALNVDANYLFQDVAKIPKKENDVTFSEFEHIKKYRSLDERGKRTIDLLIQEELKLSSRNTASMKKPVRMIQYYQRLVSTGAGRIIFDDVPCDLIEIPDIPEYRKAKYAISVNEDSMKPLYYDGDILLIEPAREISIGESGIFIVDGKPHVKKLAKIPLAEDVKCLGRIIGRISKMPELSSEDASALERPREICLQNA